MRCQEMRWKIMVLVVVCVVLLVVVTPIVMGAQGKKTLGDLDGKTS